ncbi:anti-sigma-I factor RsgI isoform X2 [Dendroctonus ponderosae]|uniref:CCDC92/74 N-terminal domain-containing protein n=1 Tax=Dendroctonus ponderosae TaxID=77166 RepID=A0AAR5PC97_DENPD|nr:anti-sigma-I factor RsgI isoform X2 [Dendroctonus ponderosae]XP_048519543.1 anti-sigma-I factor RsgI isoform X2 [Dendroctonus ponderosae]XP_048519544.1 anti-sigma-I factor RsgI isoform X2 [Dendroctonus ponderosae]
MASKVIAKLPVAPFGQVNKTKSGAVSSELIVPKLQEVQRSDDEASRAPEQVRLEQNIRFLQDQHQLMLAGLHGEIEKLKARNRDLQFQLIFGKPPTASTPASSSPSPSSPEEETRSKLYTSPQSVTNSTPLQIELLEKELGELKIQMQEQESRNLYLSAIVDEQKKKLERYDRRVEKEQQRTGGAGDPEAELRRKLEDADAVVRLLRRENSDLRRENQGMSEAAVHIPQVAHSHQHNRENGFQSPRGQGHRGGSGRGHRSNNGHNSHYNNRGGWFPPLHQQNFWQGGRTQQHERQNNGTQDQVSNLPDIPLNEGCSVPQQYHGPGRKNSNNNHYHNGDGKKYRKGHHKGNKPS